MIYSFKKTFELITLDNGLSVIFDPESGNTHVFDDIGSEILTYCNSINPISEIEFFTTLNLSLLLVEIFSSNI